MFAIGSLLVGIIVGTLFTVGTADGHLGSSLYDGCYSYLRNTADTQVKVLWLYFGGNEGVEGWKFSESNSFGVVITVASLTFILNWLGAMCWCGGLAFNVIWGVMFCMLLRGFLKLVKANSERNTLDVRGPSSPS